MSAPAIELSQTSLPPMTDQAFSLLLAVDDSTADILASLTDQEYAIASKRALDFHHHEARQVATALAQEDVSDAEDLVGRTGALLDNLVDETFIIAGEGARRRFADSLGIPMGEVTPLSVDSGSDEGASTGYIPVDMVLTETPLEAEIDTPPAQEKVVPEEMGQSNAKFKRWLVRRELRELQHAQEHPTRLTLPEVEVALAGTVAALTEAREKGDRAAELVITGGIKFILDHSSIKESLRRISAPLAAIFSKW
jgi:hypothetical protein